MGAYRQGSRYPLPLSPNAKNFSLVPKILIWRNQVAKKTIKIGGEVLQIYETIWSVIKTGYCTFTPLSNRIVNTSNYRTGGQQ